MSGSKTIGQDVRFISNQCRIWWPHLSFEDIRNTVNAECLMEKQVFQVNIPLNPQR